MTQRDSNGHFVTGHSVSTETREKIRLSLQGRKLSEEHKRKLKLNHPRYWLGKERSEGDRRKMSKSHIGIQAGDKHPQWKGGKSLDHGYVRIHKSSHPFANPNPNGNTREHRLVMAKKLGRCLKPEEVVHHNDGNKTNNIEENLKLFPNQGEHIKYRGGD